MFSATSLSSSLRRPGFQLATQGLRYASTLHGKTGGEVVYEKLKENDVDKLFLYSGGAIMPVVDAFYKGDIKFYMNTHEQSGGHAATGYAKATGKCGVSILTSGPALTNSITPITDAMSDSTPLIVISGQVPLAAMGKNAFQECPSVDITQSITKWSYCVKHVNELSDVIDKAFKIATSGKPGAVHIDLPKCVSMAICDGELKVEGPADLIPPREVPEQKPAHSAELEADFKEAVEMLSRAERPILLVGKGANSYPEQVKAFVEATNIPITTTIHAMGTFDENAPQALKFLGMHGSVTANKAMQKADLILAIGTRFDDRITGNVGMFAPEARAEAAPGIIHVNVHDEELDFVLKTDLNFHMDAGDFLSGISSYLPSSLTTNSQWIDQLTQWKETYPFKWVKAENNIIKTQDVCAAIDTELQKRAPDSWLVTTGVGNHQMMAAQFIQWRDPNSFITSGSLGVMGVGVPYSIGAQIGQPDKLVVNIDGDGSFHHTLAELKILRDYGLPVKIALMNDGEMSMVKVWEDLFFEGRNTATNLGINPDYNLLAQAFGIKGMRCDSQETLQDTVAEFLNYDGPVLCDFRVQSDMCLPLVSPGAALDNMIISPDDVVVDKDAEPPS